MAKLSSNINSLPLADQPRRLIDSSALAPSFRDGKAVVEYQLFTFGRSALATHRFISFGPIVLRDKNAATTEKSRPHKNVARGVAMTRTSATEIADAAIMNAASSLHIGSIVRENMCSRLVRGKICGGGFALLATPITVTHYNMQNKYFQPGFCK